MKKLLTEVLGQSGNYILYGKKDKFIRFPL